VPFKDLNCVQLGSIYPLSELHDWIKNWNTSVGTVIDIRGRMTGDQGSFLGRGKVFVSSPQDPERFWGTSFPWSTSFFIGPTEVRM
jgi:hypothetical protein